HHPHPNECPGDLPYDLRASNCLAWGTLPSRGSSRRTDAHRDHDRPFSRHLGGSAPGVCHNHLDDVGSKTSRRGRRTFSPETKFRKSTSTLRFCPAPRRPGILSYTSTVPPIGICSRSRIHGCRDSRYSPRRPTKLTVPVVRLHGSPTAISS